MYSSRPPACSLLRRCSRWSRLIAFAALCLLITALAVGCGSERRRYEVLSFFFDGVPVPESLRDAYPTESGDRATSPWDPRAGEAQQAREATEERIQYVYHHPYANRNCFGCHDREGGYDMIVSGPDLCRKCHSEYLKREKGDWLHGPVIVGECRMCHRPHKSEHEGLLTMAQPNLCLRCHDATFIERDPYHQRLADPVCSNCHDPHAAGNRKLLADARTYARNRNAALRRGSEHPDWGKGQCALCHRAEAAMVLVEDVNAVCLECHADQVGEAAGAVHKPVADGRCITCHTPHDSPRPDLIRPLAEQLCVECHALEEVNTPAHPKVTRVDCLLCHRGHKAARDQLLRPGIGQPLDETAAPDAPVGAPGARGGASSMTPSDWLRRMRESAG